MKSIVSRAWFWGVGILIAEILSRLVIFHPLINGVIVILMGIAFFILTIFCPASALAILSVEYLVGSKGALFKFGGDGENNGGISIRIVLFAAFLLGWFIWSWRQKTWREWKGLLRERKIYFLLALVILYGVALGWLRGNHQYLFQDANAWGAWLLLLPILDIVSHEQEKIRRHVFPAVVAALAWLPVKTLALLYLFTHHFASIDSPLYLWVRRSGVGEITSLGEGAYRIFLQSQIYAVFVLLIILAWMSFSRKKNPWMVGLLILSIAEVVASLSRSFWIGSAVGLIALFIFLLWRCKESIGFFIKTSILSKVTALLFIMLIVLFPFPSVNFATFTNMFGGRADLQENAAMSRWQLLPVLWNKIKEHPIVGSGFGATVTYTSQDPRIVQSSHGQDITYAFEWGWLEHWIKFGIIGIPMMLVLLWSLLRRTWRSAEPEWIKFGIISSIIALAAIHLFSPYLNHPLGIFALITAESMLVWFDHNKIPASRFIP